jgi:hypothetical protein
MLKWLVFLSIYFLSASLQAKTIDQIDSETVYKINKINLNGVKVVCTNDFKTILENQYDESLEKGYSPDFALQEALHRSDIISFKNGRSPLKEIQSSELIKNNLSKSNAEDLLVIGNFYDRLDKDTDASLKRILAAILTGSTDSKTTALVAKNLEQSKKVGKLDRLSLSEAVKKSIN